ncbi:MAG: DUF4244 domain-containing protein [Acidimicrobiales bacterium]
MRSVLPLVTALQAHVLTLVARSAARDPLDGPRAVPGRGRGEAGQTTAEYALVLLGAAAIAVLIISWATKTNLIGKLFDFVIDHVMGKAG